MDYSPGLIEAISNAITDGGLTLQAACALFEIKRPALRSWTKRYPMVPLVLDSARRLRGPLNDPQSFWWRRLERRIAGRAVRARRLAKKIGKEKVIADSTP